jgi:hypothetical protein
MSKRLSKQLSVQNGAKTQHGYLSTLQFTGAFWEFAAECKAAPSVEEFTRLFECWAGDATRSAIERIDACGPDDFTGWWSTGLRFVTPTLSQESNQLATLLARQGPDHPLATDKLALMLQNRWAQKNSHHWPSIESPFQSAIFDGNADLFEMLVHTTGQNNPMDGPRGMQRSLVEYAAANGNACMFEMVYNERLMHPSEYYAPYLLRRCLKIVLDTSTAETWLGEEPAEVFELILDQCQLDYLPPTIMFSVKKTCIRFGCHGINCNPMALRLIEAGAVAEWPVGEGGESTRFCPEQKSLIHAAMVDRAVAFRTAFAMGLHTRLGASSLIRLLDPGLVKAIVMAAGIGKERSPDPVHRWLPRAPPLGWGGVAIDEEEQATADLPV